MGEVEDPHGSARGAAGRICRQDAAVLSKEMNIIYVGDCGPKPSGAPISCDQLTRAFARRGWRVRVLAPALSAGDPDLAAFNAARPEIEAHSYPVPRYFFHPFERPPAD